MRHEGFEGYPYKCPAGHTTIAYGRNLDSNPLTPDEGLLLLRNDITNLEKQLEHLSWFDALDDVRKDCIINMAFNLGIRGLLRFHNTIAALKRKDYDKAADEMLNSLWATQVKTRADELAEQMRTGEIK